MFHTHGMYIVKPIGLSTFCDKKKIFTLIDFATARCVPFFSNFITLSSLEYSSIWHTPHLSIFLMWKSGALAQLLHRRVSGDRNAAVQSHKTVTDYFSCKLLLLFGFTYCSAKPKGSNCLRFKFSVAAFWLCRQEHLLRARENARCERSLNFDVIEHGTNPIKVKAGPPTTSTDGASTPPRLTPRRRRQRRQSPEPPGAKTRRRRIPTEIGAQRPPGSGRAPTLAPSSPVRLYKRPRIVTPPQHKWQRERRTGPTNKKESLTEAEKVLNSTDEFTSAVFVVAPAPCPSIPCVKCETKVSKITMNNLFLTSSVGG